ncbi:MAG: SPOR domain-containing protein [Gammaproteobacteria bacterium]|nr:SPOR domain-containing protein [Gammaproteobacteria bacterium]
MRALAVLLLVANVAFFAWRYNVELQHRLQTEQPVTPLPADAPSLKLLSELPQLPPPREAEPAAPGEAVAAPAVDAEDAAPTANPEQAEAPPAPPSPETPPPETAAVTALPGTEATPPPGTNTPQDVTATEISGNGAPSETCVSVGPFPRAEDLVQLKRWFLRHATSVHVATHTVRKRQLFWVYLEATSGAAAQRKAEELEQKGVKDYLVIQRGGIRNAISLGLFSSQDSVNKRLAEMDRQGYKPVVVPRFETTDLYWLRARLATGSEDIHAIPKELYNGTAATTIECAQIAAPGPST